MKILLSACALLAMVFSTANVFAAADVSGTWSGELSGGNGSFQLSFTFKQDGAKLTGSVQGPQGEAIAISDGKVDGDKISFNVAFNGMTIVHTGTINTAGDEIKLTSTSDQGPAGEIVLKRAKPAASAPN